MPQISLYVDKSTLTKIETAARVEHVSVSKWVGNKLRNVLSFSWPNDYFELFGSIDDASFTRQTENTAHDAKRESL